MSDTPDGAGRQRGQSAPAGLFLASPNQAPPAAPSGSGTAGPAANSATPGSTAAGGAPRAATQGGTGPANGTGTTGTIPARSRDNRSPMTPSENTQRINQEMQQRYAQLPHALNGFVRAINAAGDWDGVRAVFAFSFPRSYSEDVNQMNGNHHVQPSRAQQATRHPDFRSRDVLIGIGRDVRITTDERWLSLTTGDASVHPDRYTENPFISVRGNNSNRGSGAGRGGQDREDDEDDENDVFEDDEDEDDDDDDGSHGHIAGGGGPRGHGGPGPGGGGGSSGSGGGSGGGSNGGVNGHTNGGGSPDGGGHPDRGGYPDGGGYANGAGYANGSGQHLAGNWANPDGYSHYSALDGHDGFVETDDDTNGRGEDEPDRQHGQQTLGGSNGQSNPWDGWARTGGGISGDGSQDPPHGSPSSSSSSSSGGAPHPFDRSGVINPSHMASSRFASPVSRIVLLASSPDIETKEEKRNSLPAPPDLQEDMDVDTPEARADRKGKRKAVASPPEESPS